VTRTDPTPVEQPAAPQGWQVNSLLVLLVLALLVVSFQAALGRALSAPVMQNWMTVFIAVVTQALPFLVLGVVLSAVIAVFVPPAFFTRALPKRPALAVPVAGAAGVVLPGCECASVPVAGALVRRGVTPAAALAFLLSAPAINPVVLAATAVAFPRNPQMVLARLVASLLVACGMGWLWQRLGRPDWLRPPARRDPATDLRVPDRIRPQHRGVRGRHVPGRDRVDVHAARRPFVGQRPGQPRHRVLAHRVRRDVDSPLERQHRRDIYDLP